MPKSNDNDSLASYFQSIGRIPLLTREQELKYGIIMVEGRKKIAETLRVESNLDYLLQLLEETDDDNEEEKEFVIGLINNPNNENIKTLKDYITHMDFDMLNKYANLDPSLSLIVEEVKKARDILINSNLRLVISVAKQHTNIGLPFIDLIQEGNIGLIKAVDKFDPYRESKLATLATWWIRQAIIRSLSNKSRTIRVPVHMIDAMNRAYKKLIRSNPLRSPTPEEMLAELNMPNMNLDQIKKVMDIMSGTLSLQDKIKGGDRETTYETFISDDLPLIEEIMINDDFIKKFLNEIKILSSREEKILRLKIAI